MAIDPPCAVIFELARAKTRASGRTSPPSKVNRLLEGSRKPLVSILPIATMRLPTSTWDPLPKMMLLLPTNQTLPPNAAPTLPWITPSIFEGLRPMILFSTTQLRAPKLNVTVSSGVTSNVVQLRTVR